MCACSACVHMRRSRQKTRLCDAAVSIHCSSSSQQWILGPDPALLRVYDAQPHPVSRGREQRRLSSVHVVEGGRGRWVGNTSILSVLPLSLILFKVPGRLLKSSISHGSSCSNRNGRSSIAFANGPQRAAIQPRIKRTVSFPVDQGNLRRRPSFGRLYKKGQEIKSRRVLRDVG